MLEITILKNNKVLQSKKRINNIIVRVYTFYSLLILLMLKQYNFFNNKNLLIKLLYIIYKQSSLVYNIRKVYYYKS